jgi:phosphatidylserine decarboxylase
MFAIRETFFYFCSSSRHSFVVVSVLNDRKQTPVVKRTLNPVYNPKDATFDFPIYLSLADKIGVVELVVWDKDLLKKDYLGEVSVPLDDWFIDRRDNFDKGYGFGQPGNEVRSTIQCRRTHV